MRRLREGVRAMMRARDEADSAAAHAIERIESEIASMLGDCKLFDTPDLGGKFRGYRVGDGSIYSPLPLRQAKLALASTGLLVVVTCFGEFYHVQRAPHSMRQARILAPYIEAMKAALDRHVAGTGSRSERYVEIANRADRIIAALDGPAPVRR